MKTTAAYTTEQVRHLVAVHLVRAREARELAATAYPQHTAYWRAAWAAHLDVASQLKGSSDLDATRQYFYDMFCGGSRAYSVYMYALMEVDDLRRDIWAHKLEVARLTAGIIS